MAEKNQKPTLLVISRIPAPYREILFQRLHACNKIKLKVIYQYNGREGTAWAKNEKGLGEELTYENEALLESPVGLIKELLTFLPAILKIKRNNPNLLLIHGYNFTASWCAMLACWLFRIPYSLRSDTNGFLVQQKTIKIKIKNIFLKRLVSGANAIFFIGSANRFFWKKLGAKGRQLIEARYAVDETIFSPKENISEQNKEIKFLFVGRLIKRKRTLDLVCAFMEMIDKFKYNDCSLTIAGVGPEFDSIEQKIKDWDKDNIQLTGRCSPAAMPDLYRQHDVLVCSYTDEPWGLTINEAMSSGLAIIADTSNSCGAAIDLLQHNYNGIGIDGVTKSNLLEAMRNIRNNKKLLSGMKKGSLEIIKDWRYDSAVKSLIKTTQKLHIN